MLKIRNKLTDFFKEKRREFISFDAHGAKWTKERRAREVVLTKSTLCCEFKLGSRTFRQIVRIPMGLNPQPFFVVIYFYTDMKVDGLLH